MMKYKNAFMLLILFFPTFTIFCEDQSPQPGLSVEGCKLVNEEDRNKDGKIDRWTYLKSDGGYIVKSDNNYDGVADFVLETDKRGNKMYEEMDFNYDGEMDNFYYYTNGALVRQEIDSNFDGKIDIWIYLDQGIYITKIERDKDFDGKVDYVKKYK